MKKLLLIFLFFVSLTAAKAQDKIITTRRDTIECRIVSINAERISYEQKTADNQFVGKSISTAEVLQYFRTGNPDNFGGFGYVKARRERPAYRWLFSLQGGLAHSLNDYNDIRNFLISSDNSASVVDDYFSKLENGTHLNASLHYLLTTFFGLGVDYNLFHAASKGEFLYQGYGSVNVPLYTKLELDERLLVHFAGPSVLFQQFFDKGKRIKISETISPGIILVRNESRDSQYITYWGDHDFYNGQPPQYYQPANSISTGNTFGAKGSLSLDYAFTPQLSAGLAGNFMWAELHKISTRYALSGENTQKLATPTKISHIDYGFIVRYNF